MDKIDSWILNRGGVTYDCEELSVLDLVGKTAHKTNEVVDKVATLEDSNNKKVSHDEMNSIYKHEGSDFKGSWHGIEKPQFAEPGIAGVVDSLVSQMDDIAKLISTNEEGFLISAFNGLHNENLDLYLTTDGINFKPLHNKILFNGGKLRDPSIMFHNDKFYVAYTEQSSGGFRIAESSDLINWNTKDITLSQPICWAPEWFKDTNGDIYIFLTLGDGSTTIDIDGKTIKNTDQYFIKFNNDITNHGAITPLVFNKISVKLDSFVYKVGNEYFNFVKNEFNKIIEVYKSTDLINWLYQYDMDFGGLYLEGATVGYMNGEYHFYADAFTRQHSVYATSKDLINWTWNGQTVKAQKLRTQHFSVCKVTEDMKKKINTFYTMQNMTNGNNVEYVSPSSNPYSQKPTKIPLASMIKNNTLTVLDTEKIIYFVDGNRNFIIDKINGLCKLFYICIMAPTSQPSKITLKNSNNILTPKNADFVLSTSNNDTERLLQVVYDGTHYRIVDKNSQPNQRRFDIGTSGKITFTAWLNNGVCELKGLANDITTQSKIINSYISVINNNGNIINANGYLQGLTMEINASSYVYTITISGFPNYSVVDLNLNNGSYFI